MGGGGGREGEDNCGSKVLRDRVLLLPAVGVPLTSPSTTWPM